MHLLCECLIKRFIVDVYSWPSSLTDSWFLTEDLYQGYVFLETLLQKEFVFLQGETKKVGATYAYRHSHRQLMTVSILSCQFC